GSQLPIVCYKLREDRNCDWDLYDLADRLLMKGWQVPVYPLPKNLEDNIIQRIVIRADFGMNMAYNYVQDMQEAIEFLNKAHLK
ncbi:glutamate decarboxylase, partial [Casaltella massiliensis]|nr:glutamate decarboxylase [Casaltella massiliensis]